MKEIRYLSSFIDKFNSKKNIGKEFRDQRAKEIAGRYQKGFSNIGTRLGLFKGQNERSRRPKKVLLTNGAIQELGDNPANGYLRVYQAALFKRTVDAKEKHFKEKYDCQEGIEFGKWGSEILDKRLQNI